MARRLNVLARSYNYPVRQYVSDIEYDAPTPIKVISSRMIRIGGIFLEIVSSPGEKVDARDLKSLG
jgi:hypothetical protein